VAITTSVIETSLQSKLDATTGTTENKELLLLGKSMQAIVGVIAVGDVLDEGANQITAVTDTGTAQVAAVNAAAGTHATDISTAGVNQLSVVNTAGTTQVTAVNTAGTTQIAAVNSAIGSQLDDVEAKGTEQINLVADEGANQVNAVLAVAPTVSLKDTAETRSASIDMDNNLFLQAELRDYSETVQAMAANEVDYSLGNIHTKDVTSLTTLTFSNPPDTGKAGSFTLILNLSGSPDIIWPTSVKWAGSSPNITQSGMDVFSFMTIDGGVTWLGFTAGQGMV
jgi:hypothetical protein